MKERKKKKSIALCKTVMCVFGIAAAVVVVVWKKLFYKKYF
jgi:hypothetical protein